MLMNQMIQFVRQMSGKVGSNIYAGVQDQTSMQQMSFYRQLQKDLKEKNSLDLPLKDLKVVVFDLETTGFFPDKGDRIISIGAVKLRGDHLEDQETFYSLVHYDLPLSDEIATLTGITNDQLEVAPPISEVLMEFFKFIDSRILVAHHSKHEQAFMQRATLELLRTSFDHRIVDTSFLFGIEQPTFRSLPLEECCLKCGVELENRHHALGDAKMTAKIWGYLIRKAQQIGLVNLRDVYEYLAKMR